MWRISAILVLAVGLVGMLGCGGGSGTGGSTDSPFVTIQNTHFSPKNTTVKSGTIVQWTNLDSSPTQVVSGTLDKIGNASVVHTINITLTGFDPPSLTANFGDTIQFNNISGNAFSMNVYNDNNSQILPTINFLVGQQQVVDFPGAGLYIFRKNGSAIFQGSLILYGRPHADGQFQSPVLAHGEVFKRQFDTVRTFPFYAPNLDNPDLSFRTGTIVVQ